MSDEIICPDCDGVIGGEPGAGRRVCRCFETRKSVAVAPPPPAEDVSAASAAPSADASTDSRSGSTAGGSSAGTATADPSSDAGAKPCRLCGKDLRGHRRLKDARGYMCPSCAKSEQFSDVDANLIPCPECGRKLKADGITTYNGAVMCKRCAADFKELHKYKGPPPTLVKHDEHQKASLQKLLIIGGVLVLIMLLAYFGLIGG